MRTRRGSDFIVGLVTIIALIVLVIGVLWLKGEGFSSSQQTYSVLFPQVGGLQVGDPVAVNGLRVGSVSDITLSKDLVLVKLGLQKKQEITSASKVVVVESGLLGEKKVEIFYVSGGTPIDPKSPHPIQGEYRGGIAEAAASLGAMAKQVSVLLDTLQESINELASKMQGDNSIVSFLDTLVTRLDTITLATERIVVGNEDKIKKILNI